MIRKRHQHKAPEKVHQALELLGEAALDKRDEFYQALESQYDDLRKTVGNASTAILEKASELRERTGSAIQAKQRRIKASISQKAKQLDKKIHRNPWPFVGVIAAGTLIIGYRLTRKRRIKQQNTDIQSTEN